MVNEPHALDREELLEDTAPDQAVVQPYSEDADNDDAVTLQMDAPLDDGEWMVEVSRGERRTLSTEQLTAELASGALGPEVRVWRNGMPGWGAAAQMELATEAGRTTSPTVPASVRAAVASPPAASEPSAVALLVASTIATPATPALAGPAPLPSAAAPSTSLPSTPFASTPFASTPLASTAPMGALRPAPLPPVPLPPVPMPPVAASQRRVPAPPPSRPVTASSSFSGSLPLSPPPPRIVPRAVEARSVEPRGYAASEPLPAFDEALRSSRPDTATSVALDLQQVAPRRSSPLRGIVAQGAAAAFAILLTSYGLTRAGVFDSGAASVSSEPVAHGTPASKEPATTEVLALQAPAELPAVAAEPAAAPPTAAGAEPPTTAAASVAAAEGVPAAEGEAAVAAAETAGSSPAAVAEAPPVKATDVVAADAQKASVPSAKDAPAAGAQDPNSPAALRRAKQAERRAAAEERRAAAEERRAAAAEERKQKRATSVPARAVGTPPRATETSVQEPGSNFNREAATAALEGAATQAKNCRPMGGPSGAGIVQVQYEPTGKVVSANIVTAGFENSAAADCIEMLFRRAKVPAFNGTKPVTMKQRFEIP